MIKIITTAHICWLFRLLCVLLLINGKGLAAPSTPTADFIDHGEGIVTHKLTGFMWKRCVEGQTWNNNTCTGTYATYTHAQALRLPSTYGWRSGWRLPTLKELRTIMAQENFNPTINTKVFPKTPATAFWTATVDDNARYGAWNVSFFSGIQHYDLKTEAFAVRLMRVVTDPKKR